MILLPLLCSVFRCCQLVAELIGGSSAVGWLAEQRGFEGQLQLFILNLLASRGCFCIVGGAVTVVSAAGSTTRQRHADNRMLAY